MPTYQIFCDKCEKAFEIFTKKIQDVCKCPECNGDCKRKIIPVNVHYKVTGFYKTDYKDKEIEDLERQKAKED